MEVNGKSSHAYFKHKKIIFDSVSAPKAGISVDRSYDIGYYSTWVLNIKRAMKKKKKNKEEKKKNKKS